MNHACRCSGRGVLAEERLSEGCNGATTRSTPAAATWRAGTPTRPATSLLAAGTNHRPDQLTWCAGRSKLYKPVGRLINADPDREREQQHQRGKSTTRRAASAAVA
jgi:hypothetical protein